MLCRGLVWRRGFQRQFTGKHDPSHDNKDPGRGRMFLGENTNSAGSTIGYYDLVLVMHHIVLILGVRYSVHRHAQCMRGIYLVGHDMGAIEWETPY